MPSPNTDFSSGQVLTAAAQNKFPRGIIALATSSTNYTLTTSAVIATGMTVTFIPVANRYYKITYIEPQAGTPAVAGGFTTATIRLTSATGTQLAQSVIQTSAASSIGGSVICQYLYSGSAVSTTIVGCGATSSTTGAPVFTRGATNLASLLVEDIGPV